MGGGQSPVSPSSFGGASKRQRSGRVEEVASGGPVLPLAGGVRFGFGAQSPEASTEEDWQRRTEKRVAAIRVLKDSDEYRSYAAARDAVGVPVSSSAGPVPGTPPAQ